MLKIFFSIFFLILSMNLFSQEILLNRKDDNDTIIKYKYFVVCYDKKEKESHWSSYFITKSRKYGQIERSKTFKADPNIKDISTSLCAYKVKNYDIGHLATASDMSFNQQAMDECFYFTNVCPQWYSFNRGPWKSLETHVRNLSELHDSVFVVCGVTWNHSLTKSSDTTCGMAIPMPDKFFKIIHISKTKEWFYYLFPNTVCDKDFKKYLITKETFEKTTGYLVK